MTVVTRKATNGQRISVHGLGMGINPSIETLDLLRTPIRTPIKKGTYSYLGLSLANLLSTGSYVPWDDCFGSGGF